MSVQHLLVTAGVPAAVHVAAQQAVSSYALTPGRLWSFVAIGIGLVGVVVGGLALARPAGRIGIETGRLGATLALAAGLVGAIGGAVVVATSGGQLGTGGGLAGGGVAVVLGLVGVTLGGLALVRARRAA